MSFSKNYSSEDTSADAADSEATTSSHSGSSRFILLFSSRLPHPQTFCLPSLPLYSVWCHVWYCGFVLWTSRLYTTLRARYLEKFGLFPQTKKQSFFICLSLLTLGLVTLADLSYTLRGEVCERLANRRLIGLCVRLSFNPSTQCEVGGRHGIM